jgi:peptidoglycan L-alanyl-D-glutamate endopeptidase CwlK
MYKFSKKSQEQLDTCCDALRVLCNEIIEVYDITVIQGYRSNEEQDKLFNDGFSKVKGGQSKHNTSPSKAVDIAPYPIDWHDRDRYFYLAGIAFKIAQEYGFKIRWGGDWKGEKDFASNGFNDLGHFEMID